MPDWLNASFDGEVQLHAAALAVRLLIALALGAVVAGIYRLTQGRRGAQSLAMMATFVMLTVLIAMVTLIIGNNVARAFSLVGALAIVRFRTVVEDTRDTAFVIFAVTVGMAVGAGAVAVPLVGIPVVAAAAFLFRPRPEALFGPSGISQRLVVRVGPGYSGEGQLRAALEAHAELWRLVGTETARQGTALEKTYWLRPRAGADMSVLVSQLNRLEGVQSVALQEA